MHEDDLQKLDSLDPQRIDFPRALVAVEELAPHARGRWFEKLLVALLRRDGLDAWHDPGTARPRQTDAGFQLGEAFYLVEAKWMRRRAQPEDLASVRDRLSRVPGGTGACLVSMEGFTSGVVNDLREKREKEILLVDGDEVRSIALGDSFRKLIEEKRRRFRIHAEVWFQRDGTRERAVVLPTSSNSLFVDGSHTLSVVSRKGRTCDLHFSIDTLEVETYHATASIELESSAENVQQLATLLSTLHARLQLDNEGSFAIHQLETSWFGFGAEAFIEELRNVDRRYVRLGKGENLHHSESASLISHFDGGLVAVLTQQRVNSDEHRLHGTYVEVTMNGIPLDLERLRALADDVDGRDVQLRIRPANDDYRTAARIRKPPRVEALGSVHTNKPGPDGESFVEGIVIKNPFIGREAYLKRLLASERWAYDLAQAENLVCWLRSTHCVGDRVDHYRLQRIQCEQLGSVAHVRVEADWGNIEYCERSHTSSQRNHHAPNKAAPLRRSKRSRSR